MNVELILGGLAFLVRGEGAALRRLESQPILQLTGWLLSLSAVWLLMVAAGAWPPVWPLPFLALAGLALQLRWAERRERQSLPLVLDLLVVIVSGLLSVPPLKPLTLLATAVLLLVIALIIDWLVAQLRRRLSWITIVGAGLLPLLAILLVAEGRESAMRFLGSRFIYLMPEEYPEPGPQPAPEKVALRPGLDEASGRQWTPYLEWSLTNTTYEGNPYDLVARATFVHRDSGESRTTGMFYDGDDTWRFRFTATRPGGWTFTTQSNDPELDGHKGVVEIRPNPGAIGFVTNYGNKWGRMGIDEAFVPQFAMIGGPHTYYNNPAEIETNIQTFLVEHGFNGVHTPVFCRWFDINRRQCSRINVDDPSPDRRTFRALEALISEVHSAGGVVHIWMWGDDSRSENPKRWGLNDEADKRLQRYIAARLGPLPGWTMSYGYDLFEWVSGGALSEWHDFMQAEMGWRHLLGARSSKNMLNQLSEEMDYSSYEQHRPDYAQYVRTIEERPGKPSFSEDRFRIREQDSSDKDYTMEATRRGLWHSTMAGGVANIWGNLVGAPEANDGSTTSAPYTDRDLIKTYSRFFEDRFRRDMIRCNELTNGVCLRRPTNAHYVFYREDATVVQMDLSEMDSPRRAVAVDARLPYEEIDLGLLDAAVQSWIAPYESDWAIAVGDFN
ncbi:MAG TPA: DUF5060 domain-containing protein [Anaerolineae bacterium]